MNIAAYLIALSFQGHIEAPKRKKVSAEGVETVNSRSPLGVDAFREKRYGRQKVYDALPLPTLWLRLHDNKFPTNARSCAT
jgi:hypothetical protein